MKTTFLHRAAVWLMVQLVVTTAAAAQTAAPTPTPIPTKTPLYQSCGAISLNGRAPLALASADFNRDQIPDVAIVDSQGNQLLVLLVNKKLVEEGVCERAGTTNTTTLENGGAIGLDIADLRNNGVADAVTAQERGVGVLLNDGTGALDARVPIPVGSISAIPRVVVTGDFDGDGVLDIAAGTSDRSVELLYGKGSGNFGEPSISFEVDDPIDALVSADFNLDGRQDLAAMSNVAGTVQVLLGDPASTAGRGFIVLDGFSVGTAPVALAAADFDRDGLPDLGVVNGVGVPLLLPTPTRTSTGTPTPIESPTRTLTPTRSETPIGEVSPTGTPTPTPTATFTVTRTPHASGEFTVFLARATPGGTTLTFDKRGPLPAGRGPAGLAVGDFDRDGKTDAAITDITDDCVIFYFGNGDGSFTAGDPCPYDTCEDSTKGTIGGCRVGIAPRALSLAFLDGDARPDFIVGNSESADVSILLTSNPPPTVTGTATITPTPTPTGPTVTPTSTRTATPSPPRPSPTRTETPADQIFQIRGESCAIDAHAGSGLSMLPVLALVAFALWRRGRSAEVKSRRSTADSQSGT